MLNPTGYKTPAGGLGGARGRPLLLGGPVATGDILLLLLLLLQLLTRETTVAMLSA